MQLDIPAVYRVHEAPKEKRLNDYREDVLSHGIRCGDLNHRPEIQKLLAKLGEMPAGDALKIGLLRSLMRARYAVEPLGHYGLAKKKYAHFTSPIRRYADLVVHRALFDKTPVQASEARRIAEHISLTEKNSADAERDSKEVKLYAFLESQMKARRPQPYSALVTDVRNFGFFVDVSDLGLNGLVPFSAIPDDFFTFDPARGQLIGRHSRRIIRLGDRVTVQIHRIDRYKKQVDFQLVSERGERPVQGGGRRVSEPESRPRRGSSDRRPAAARQRTPEETGAKPHKKREPDPKPRSGEKPKPKFFENLPARKKKSRRSRG
jgi:ribonuclease R